MMILKKNIALKDKIKNIKTKQAKACFFYWRDYMGYNRLKVMEYAEKYYYDGNSEYINFDKQTDNDYTDCAN